MRLSIKEIWRNKSAILEGIRNSVIKNDEIEAIAQERLRICNMCPLIDQEGSSCMVPGTQPCCSQCGCKLSFKVRSLSSECPHPHGSLWDAILTDEEQDKLYEKIGYNPEE